MSIEFFDFARDFFGVKPQPKVHAYGYEWITTTETPSVVDNQGPGCPTPLFSRWVAEGWEVVSVDVFPTTLSTCMCKAVGVLRRPVPRTGAEP